MEWLFCVPAALQSAVFREDKMKLVVSYLIYPVLSLLLLYLRSSFLAYFLPPSTGSLLIREVLLTAIVYLYCFFLLPPSIVRFVVKREGVRYGLEAFLYTASLTVLSLCLSYAIGGVMLFPGILDLIAVHNILTYRTTGGNTMGVNERNIASLLSFVVLSAWGWVVFGNGFPFSRNGLALWGPLIGVYYILNSHKDVFQGAEEAARDRKAPASSAGAPVPRAQSADVPMGTAVVYPWEEERSEGPRTETVLGPAAAEEVPSASPEGRDDGGDRDGV